MIARSIILALAVAPAALCTLNRQKDDHEEQARNGQNKNDFDKGKTLVFLNEIAHLLTFHLYVVFNNADLQSVLHLCLRPSNLRPQTLYLIPLVAPEPTNEYTGIKMAAITPPTTTPSTTIIIGSMVVDRFLTSSSTSSS